MNDCQSITELKPFQSNKYIKGFWRTARSVGQYQSVLFISYISIIYNTAMSLFEVNLNNFSRYQIIVELRDHTMITLEILVDVSITEILQRLHEKYVIFLSPVLA